MEQSQRWTFLPRRALLTIARDPTMRLREVAAVCHLPERTVADLEQAGCLDRTRPGTSRCGIRQRPG
ncbi:hypothetical protein [Streptomyces sp. NPDC048419]|uniref:hypothetical protein n=1 Tax=Streptomyces sp. NPDC048419 TaxID=3365547 RepID=UPI00371D0F3C